MEALLHLAESRELHIDAYGWHEFGRPEQVADHVEDFRRLLKSHPKLASGPILIDEYQSEAQHLLPGFAVGWLYYLEQSGVQQAMRACWDLPKPSGGLFETCWTGLNGCSQKTRRRPHRCIGFTNATRV